MRKGNILNNDMKRIHSFQIILVIIAVMTLIAGSHAAQKREASSPTADTESAPAEQLKEDMIIACEWDAGDKSEKTICIVTPPEAKMQIKVLDYALKEKDSSLFPAESPVQRGKTKKDKIKVLYPGMEDVPSFSDLQEEKQALADEILKQIKTTPEGYFRFHYLQSIRINPALMQRALVPGGTSGSNSVLSSVALGVAFILNPEKKAADRNESARGLTTGVKSRASFEMDDPAGFDHLLPLLARNPEMASRYACENPPIRSLPREFPFDVDPEKIPDLANNGVPVIQIYIKQPGFYMIDREMIRKMGIVPAKVNPNHFHLFCAGREIPMFPWGCLAEYFTEMDALMFYAFPAESPYTEVNVFQLYYDPARTPLRMEIMGDMDAPYKDAASPAPIPEEPDYYIATQVMEEDNELKIHAGNFLSIKGMRWVFREITAGNPLQISFPLDGFKPVPGKGTGKLRMYFQPDEWSARMKIELTLNDSPPHAFNIKNVSDDTKTFDIDFSELKGENNRITIKILPLNDSIEDFETEARGCYFDNLTMEYPRRYLFYKDFLTFQIPALEKETLRTYNLEGAENKGVPGFEYSDPYHPRFIRTAWKKRGMIQFTAREKGNSKYFFSIKGLIPIPGEMRIARNKRLADSENGAEYLIITHPDFIPALEPLSEHWQKKGFITKIVDVEDIYDEFNFGILSPIAIKKFLIQTLTRWKIKPEYALLVGDSTSDYKNEARNDIKNYLPTFSHISRLGDQDKWASDHWYATLLGEDEYPDIHLGRISVNNPKDAENVVNKTLYYANHPVQGTWRAALGYVADNGPFDEDAEELRLIHAPLSYSGKTAYLDDLPLEDNFYLERRLVEKIRAKVSPVATGKIFDLFQKGCILMSFFGHGSPNIWTDERIWFGGDSLNSDNLHLTNLDRLTFVTNMTCNSGAIDYPVPKWNICITEDCMRQPGGGAIGLFVPSGPGYRTSHIKISAHLLDVLFHEGVHRLGDAITLARSRYLLAQNQVDIIQMFILLGDPALPLQIPGEDIELQTSQTDIEPDDLPMEIKIFGAISSLEKGEVLYQLYSPDNQLLMETKPKPFDKGHLEHRFTIPKDGAAGEWVIRCYAFHSETMKDAVGSVRLSVGESLLVLKNPRVERSDERIAPGDTVPISVDVSNKGIVSCPNALVNLAKLANLPEKTIPLSRNLDSGETRIYTWEIAAEKGLNILRFEIPDHQTPLDPAIPIHDRELLTFVASEDEASSSDLAIATELITRTYTQTDDKIQMQINLPIYNLGNAPVEYAHVIMQSEDGTVIRRMQMDSILPGLPRPVLLTVEIDNPEDDRDYIISAYPSRKQNEDIEISKSRDPNLADNTIRVSHDASCLCDLSIDAREIRISEESPTEGKTIFFDVSVSNLGKSPAQNARIGLYDKEPENGGKPLFNYMTDSEYNLSWLAPAKTKTIRLRWDPVNNSGEQRIYFKADSQNRVAELEEENNLAHLKIRVRTKADLKPMGMEIRQTPEEKKALIARLVAKVKNNGETEAKNVSVRFFKGKVQTEATRIGETLIPRIDPGETAETVMEWKLTGEDARFTYKPTYQVFLKGSSQRLSHVEETEEQSPK
ncbi:hypothetical protein JW926_12530 [Candidatus Sumerlaeota bacterium]|nr:hypothetical protein [Candidatus Sumerlaeota bacterium]